MSFLRNQEDEFVTIAMNVGGIPTTFSVRVSSFVVENEMCDDFSHHSWVSSRPTGVSKVHLDGYLIRDTVTATTRGAHGKKVRKEKTQKLLLGNGFRHEKPQLQRRLTDGKRHRKYN